MSDVRDRWAAAATYEDYMGRWSRRLSPRFVAWLRSPANAHWLEIGCGTGALTSAICAQAAPASIVACDPAEPFVDYARAALPDPRVTFVVAGVDNLPRRLDGYQCVTSSLALNFFADTDAAIDLMRSATAPQGVLSACVWDYSSGMEFLRYFWDAARAIDERALAFDEDVRFPVCRPDALTALFRQAGLSDIRCEAVDTSTVFTNFDDYWRPFLGGTGPAPSYVASLSNDHRAELARSIEASLPRGPDDSISLTARAWAIRGLVS